MNIDEMLDRLPMFNDVREEWEGKLLPFLARTKIVSRMTDAANAGRPPAEVIAADLLSEFGEKVKRDRVKQFTGLLIRFVMEKHGFRVATRGRTCRPNPVFTVASTYERS